MSHILKIELSDTTSYQSYELLVGLSLGQLDTQVYLASTVYLYAALWELQCNEFLKSKYVIFTFVYIQQKIGWIWDKRIFRSGLCWGLMHPSLAIQINGLADQSASPVCKADSSRILCIVVDFISKTIFGLASKMKCFGRFGIFVKCFGITFQDNFKYIYTLKMENKV